MWVRGLGHAAMWSALLSRLIEAVCSGIKVRVGNRRALGNRPCRYNGSPPTHIQPVIANEPRSAPLTANLQNERMSRWQT